MYTTCREKNKVVELLYSTFTPTCHMQPDHSMSSEYKQELKPPQVWYECWYYPSKWRANKSL